MSGPQPLKDQNSLDLVLRNQVNTNNSRCTASVDDGRDGIRTGLAAAPAEVIHLICRLLCRCSYCEHDPDLLGLPQLSPVRFRDDLDSLSRTCKFVRDVAQPYLFHVFGHNDRHKTRRLALKLSVQLPHVANQIRRIILNSVCGELFLLNRLTGLQTLRVIATKAGALGLESQLSFPCLKEFWYGPYFKTTDSVVPMEDARKDLRAILSAAENLSHLRCQSLQHKSSTTPFILLRLPACKITILELHECWLPHNTCKRFLANFTCLENFRFKRTMKIRYASGLYDNFPADGPERVADATDMIEGLRPSKKTLKLLCLNFGSEHNTEFGIFRPLPSIMDFTALRTLHVTQGELGYPIEWPRESLSDTLSNSMKRLFIDDFDMNSRKMLLDLAKRALAGQYPNLKHVRLKGLVRQSMDGSSFLASMQGDLEYGEDDGSFDRTNTDGQGEDEEDNGSDTDWSFHDFMTSDEEWGAVIRRCLNDHVLMSSIAPHVRDDSQMMLYSALTFVPLRKKVRALFSRADIKFECVGVVIKNSVDGGVHSVWM